MKLKKLYIVFIIVLLINTILCSHSNGANFNANSPSAILFNSNTEKILYEKNAYEIRYPASTTKIMTAILALENCNLDDLATVSNTAIQIPFGYTTANLQPGEIISINDLLHLLLIISANDAANVLAEHVSGSINEFSNMMTAKAKEIGCLNTNFTNPSGIHNSNHYSTAYDLCLIANYAMKNEIFRQIVSTTTYTIPSTNKSEERILTNTNRLLHEFVEKSTDNNIYYYEFATGIKTGYTTEAKNCLVASAKKDGTEYIAVILASNANETFNNSQRFSDVKNLFITAFENYSLSTIKHVNDVVTNVEIKNVDFFGKNLDLLLTEDLTLLIKNEDLEIELQPEITLYEDKLQAPICQGDVLGTVTYSYDRNILYTKYCSC